MLFLSLWLCDPLNLERPVGSTCLAAGLSRNVKLRSVREDRLPGAHPRHPAAVSDWRWSPREQGRGTCLKSQGKLVAEVGGPLSSLDAISCSQLGPWSPMQ